MEDLYFAYGSNMDRVQMAARCPGATEVGRGVLVDHRYVINIRGVATIVPAPGSVVHGLLWELGPGHDAELDRYEGVAHGLYRRERLAVETPDGGSVGALVYVAGESAPGVPRPGYQEMVEAAARAAGCPGDYCDELRTWVG